jgi:integrase
LPFAKTLGKFVAMNGNVGNAHGSGFGKGVFRIVEFANPSGGTAFRVAGWTVDGKRVRENFKTHGEAVSRKTELEIQSANLATAGQTVFTRLTPTQVNDAEAGRAALDRMGYKQWSFSMVVDFFGRNYRDPLKRISVADAVTRFTAEKKSANRRARYLKDLKLELGYLTVKHGSKLTHEVQKEDLVEVIMAGDRGAERQNNIRKDFRTFFNWCVANGYAQSNPAELVPIKTVERGEIVTLSLEKVGDLMKAAAGYKGGKLVPYISLATFCAIRPDELARLSWDQVDLKERQVTITASAAKKRGRRVVDIPDNCVAWLSPHAKKKKAIKGRNWRKDLDRVKALVGFGNPKRMPQGRGGKDKKKWAHLKPWPQDVLRHTGISCHYRLHEDEGKTASWAGNSPDMIHAHYRALVSAKDAKAFFEIVPGARGGVAKASERRWKGKVVSIEDVAANQQIAREQGLATRRL